MGKEQAFSQLKKVVVQWQPGQVCIFHNGLIYCYAHPLKWRRLQWAWKQSPKNKTHKALYWQLLDTI